MNNNFGIIMAGGIGSRFWPMSTEEKPKQFLDFLGTGKSLIQMTFSRLRNSIPVEQIYILTNSQYKDLVLEQLPELKPNQVLCEPQRKNTAPCIAFAAAKISAINPNANLIVCPADHLIMQEEKFSKSIETALKSSEAGRIATLGIQPTRPDTGYGYIQFENEGTLEANTILQVQQFREKPDLKTAEEFIASGNFYWNAGIFVWKASTIEKSMREFQPELANLFFNNKEVYNSSAEEEHLISCFEKCEDISIDYAIMERAKNIDIVLTDFDWSDLGTWGSLFGHVEKDSNNNFISNKSIHTFETSNTLIQLEEETEAIIDGLDNYIIVQSKGKLMILKKGNEQLLKEYMKVLK